MGEMVICPIMPHPIVKKTNSETTVIPVKIWDMALIAIELMSYSTKLLLLLALYKRLYLSFLSLREAVTVLRVLSHVMLKHV